MPNAILVKSIEALTSVVNLSTGLSHAVDESRAKELFKALSKRGIQLDAEVIRQIAIGNGWSTRHADGLAELGQRIGSGGRVVIKYRSDWGQATIDKVIKELDE